MSNTTDALNQTINTLAENPHSQNAIQQLSEQLNVAATQLTDIMVRGLRISATVDILSIAAGGAGVYIGWKKGLNAPDKVEPHNTTDPFDRMFYGTLGAIIGGVAGLFGLALTKEPLLKLFATDYYIITKMIPKILGAG